MLDYQCPHCKTILSIPEQFVGSTGTCRKCHKSITIDVQPAYAPKEAADGAQSMRPPTLVAFHIETTGPASRRHAIIELAAIKVDAEGSQLDTFWSFCNPDQAIPEEIVERTGITEDMVAPSPYAFEVVRQWFDWIGPRAILFTEHAHFHAKFVSAALLKEDFEPPAARVIDVVHWAEDLQVPTDEYKLRSILESLGHPPKPVHRAMDSCNGIVVLLQHLFKIQAGRMPHEPETGVLGRLLGRKHVADTDEKLFQVLDAIATPLDRMCGSNFHEREKYEERKQLRAQADAGGNGTGVRGVTLHMPEWYEERRRILESCRLGDAGTQEQGPKMTAKDAGWTKALLEASQAPTSEEQRQHLLQAISLGARDPWPYERLTGFYLRAKDYKSAQKICERYFEGENWRLPNFADSSLKLLHKMQRIERRLVQSS